MFRRVIKEIYSFLEFFLFIRNLEYSSFIGIFRVVGRWVGKAVGRV